MGGRAVVLDFDRDDADYNCTPHAIDSHLDDIEVEEAEGEDLLKETSDDAAWVGALSHETTVVKTALNSAGAATGGSWSNDANDPVKEVNAMIVDVIKAAGGGNIEVGIVFDPTSLLAFFANAKTKGYFPGQESIAPTEENLKKLFLGRVTARISFMVTDTAPVGKAKAVEWLMSSKVLVFARSSNPTRRDPSFMKTFRLRNRWMVLGSYRREDDRGDTIKLDWSADVQVVNSGAARLFTVA